MNSSTLIGIIVALVLVVGGFYLFQGDSTPTENGTDTENTQTENTNEQDTADNNQTDTTTDTTNDTGNTTDTTDNTDNTGDNTSDTGTPQTHSVTYSASGFSPRTVNVSVGDTVTFTSSDGSDMWVASDVHPTHSLYGGSNISAHCPDTSGSAFDQCSTGTTYSFTFDKAGAWKFHNHVRANHTGTVTVTQ